MTEVNERIQALQEAMKKEQFDYYIIPSEDAHASEYVASYWKARAYFSGFTGSAGTLVVGLAGAYLWVDGRYHIQGEKQTEGTGIQLFKMGLEGVPELDEWLVQTVKEGQTVAFDGRMVSLNKGMQWKKKMPGVKFAADKDLLTPIWTDRPALPTDPVWELTVEFAGESRADKLARVRQHLTEKKAEALLLTSLEDTAWLMNLRGNDILHTPVFYAYSVIARDQAYLFADQGKFSEEILNNLKKDGVEVLPYDGLSDFFDQWAIDKEQLEKEGKEVPKKILIFDPARLNMMTQTILPAGWYVLQETNITTFMKARKNAVEQKNIRKAHEMDGVAMCKFLYWMKKEMKQAAETGVCSLTEADAADFLAQCRMDQGAFDLSFDTIAGYGGNGAITHYHTERGTDAKLSPEGLMVVDSGGQYKQGTTDITRTIAMGPLTEEMRRVYTLVLKGHLALGHAKFMENKPGYYLDILAREPLWQAGLDYLHGTGHGVGYVLSVHEGPMNIGFRYVEPPLQEGQLISDEPGYYAEGKFGIRIENLCLVQKAEKTTDGQFLKMDFVTLCPYEREAIDVSMLTPVEIEQVDQYHQWVYETIAPKLEAEEAQWLKAVCAPLNR